MPKAKGAESALTKLKDLPFEEALKRLETIVESMEAQDLPLKRCWRVTPKARSCRSLPGQIKRKPI